MKTPRVTDFDPDAKVPALKSSLDDMPTIEKPSYVIKKPVASTPTLKIQKTTQSMKPQDTGRHLDNIIRDVRPVRPVLGAEGPSA